MSYPATPLTNFAASLSGRVIQTLALAMISPTRAFHHLDGFSAIAVLASIVLLQCAAIFGVVESRPTFLVEAVERQIVFDDTRVTEPAVRAALHERARRVVLTRTPFFIKQTALLCIFCLAFVRLIKRCPTLGDGLIAMAMLTLLASFVGVSASGGGHTPWIDALVMAAACAASIWLLHTRGDSAIPVLRAVAVASVLPAVGFVLSLTVTVIFDRVPGHFSLARLMGAGSVHAWLRRVDVFGLWWALAAAGGLAVITGRRYAATAAVLVLLSAVAMLSGFHF
jgi:hypothetical protein